MKKAAMILAMVLTGIGSSWAAAPVLHVTKTVTIDAPASKVWSTIKDFNGWNAWHPAVAKDEIVAGKNNSVGAVRLLTLQDGGTIKEKLLAFNGAQHRLRYAILESVLPVSSYTSSLVVTSAGKGRSTVAWSGSFKRKNVGDNPGDKENDKVAVETMNGVYQSGLDNLKKILEAE